VHYNKDRPTWTETRVLTHGCYSQISASEDSWVLSLIAIQRALNRLPFAPIDGPKGISEQVSNFAIVLVVPSRGIFDAQQIRTSERPFGSSILVSPAWQTPDWNQGMISIIDSMIKAGLACYIWDRELMARTFTGTLR